MPKAKESVETKIINYFRTESLDKAEVMLGLVTSEVKARRPPMMRKPAKAKKAQVAKKLNAAPVALDSVENVAQG